MTPEQINIAIAEACGWEPDKHFNEPAHWHKGVMLARSWNELPNYCGDLNAMHEAEKALIRGRGVEKYAALLHREIVRDDKDEYWSPERLPCTDRCHASAIQRARTLLRTIGKWKDAA